MYCIISPHVYSREREKHLQLYSYNTIEIIQSHGFHAGSMRDMFSKSAAALIKVVTFDSPPSNSAKSKEKWKERKQNFS